MTAMKIHAHAQEAVREFITPEIARAYLGRNTHNRVIRERSVDSYAADMVANNWVYNGESIKFSANGVLIDGQHRLLAIIQAGVGVWLLVVRGLDDIAQDTVDAGMSRKFADVLKLRGETNCSPLASTVRGIHAWENGERRFGRGSIVPATNTQLSATLDRYPWIRDGMPIVGAATTHVGLPCSVGGPLWWMFMRLDRDDTDAFFDRLTTGENLAATNPIFVLRRQLLASRENRRGGRNVTQLAAITVKAWNKFRAGDEVHRLQFSPGGANPEPFPVPR